MRLSATILAGLVIAGASAATASAQPQNPARQCFRMSQMQGYRVTPDARSFYMRVGVRDIYRVDLEQACPKLRQPGVHLVTKVTDDLICSRLDFDLRVAENGPGGFPVPCLVSGFERLSPEAAKALPRKLTP